MANEAAPPVNTDNANNTTTQARRRSSGLMPGFDSLQQQKRGSEANTVRRQSLSDQQSKPGFIGSFFHNNFGRNAK